MTAKNSVVLFFAVCLFSSGFSQKTADELIDSVKGYDPRQRPIDPNNQNAPTLVTVSLYILDIGNIDDSAHTFAAQLYFRQKWADVRLKYNDKDTRLLHYDDHPKVWKPDLFFVDETHAKVHTSVMPNTFFRWEPNGTMFLSIRFTITSRCQMNLRLYPHDEHLCTMQIESYGYSAKDVMIEWEKSFTPVAITNRINEPGFKVKSISHNVSLQPFTFGNYSQLFVNIELTRNTGFFIIKIYFPFIVLTLVAWLSLWIHPRQVQFRMPLLLLVIGIMFLLATDISEFVPRMPYTKAIDIWIAFCISMVFGLFLEYVLIIQISKDSDTEMDDTEKLTAEEKEDSMRSHFIPLKTNLERKFYAVHRRLLGNADRITRYAYLGIFTLFNIIYWSVYSQS